MCRLQELYDISIAKYGYRISPRMPLKYCLARAIQRMYMDTKNRDITMDHCMILTELLEHSLTTKRITCLEDSVPGFGSDEEKLETIVVLSLECQIV